MSFVSIQFAYDGVFAVAHAIQDMRAACVPSAQMTNCTVLMQYLRATSWIGASGLVKVTFCVLCYVAANAARVLCGVL